MSPGWLTLRRLVHHRLALIGALLLVLLITATVAADVLEMLLGISATRVDLFNRLQGPSTQHWLGTDELGRDVLLRLLHGGRVSLSVGLTGALLAALLGTVLGVLAGYFGGRLDALLMRFTDGVIALPLLPLLIVLAALDPEKLGLSPELARSEQLSIYRIVIIVALFGWTMVARLVRSATLSVRERDFVIAAVGAGAGPLRIMRVHILPNVMTPIIIATTLSVGHIILLESVLSFLGLGIQPPIPSWGNMLSNAQTLIGSAPALAFYPGILIFLTVIAFNFLGDGLQEALDPRSLRRRP